MRTALGAKGWPSGGSRRFLQKEGADERVCFSSNRAASFDFACMRSCALSLENLNPELPQ